MRRRVIASALLLTLTLVLPLASDAQKPIKVGVLTILSGPGALFGEPVSKGALMFAEEINAAGGVLGRKFELIVRDTKGVPDDAVRVARELILKDGIDFLQGTFTSNESPAVSVVAKENKIVFIATIPATDRLTAPDQLHPYIFRVAKNTTIEGRAAAEVVAKWRVKRIATISPDYAYGQDVTKAFVDHLKKIAPQMEIVDQQWPKIGEADYTPFIIAQMAKKPDAAFSSLFAGHFVTFAKQAKPLGYFDAINYNFMMGAEGGAHETTAAMGADYPFGIWSSAYDAFYWNDGPPQHKPYIARLSKFMKTDQPSSFPIQGYIGMQFLTEAIKKANSTDSDKVAKALLGLSVDTPIGTLTIRAKDHQANRGNLWGQMAKDPKYPFAILKPITYVDPTRFMD
jgi:branched-chain amino acid transport system substrate-binding protein